MVSRNKVVRPPSPGNGRNCAWWYGKWNGLPRNRDGDGDDRRVDGSNASEPDGLPGFFTRTYDDACIHNDECRNNEMVEWFAKYFL